MDDATTLVELLARQARDRGPRTALLFKEAGVPREMTWSEVGDQVKHLAAGLARLGVLAGDRVVQLSENRYEWILCDLAIQLARGVHVPVHAPLSASQAAFQIVDSGARIVLVSDVVQAEKLASVAGGLPAGLHFLAFDDVGGRIGDFPVEPLSNLAEGHSPGALADVEQRALRELNGDSHATILYTSGTTGEPKGVVLNQRNLVSNVAGMMDVIALSEDDRRLNFLPLSHIFARTCDVYTWLASGTELSLAESRESVIADCAAAQPTLLNGVPFFFDKVRRTLEEQGRENEPDILRRLFGGRIRLLGSGGAALPDHVFDFYLERGLPIHQGYGLTESSPVISASGDQSFQRGASGRPIPGVEVRIAEDGEILTRGPHVMVGYYNQPEATAEVIRDGWLYTGDLGCLDDEGFLFINGRKKEILVTSGGKNIAPVNLEMLLCEDPLIIQALVVGDGRDYLTALVVPDPDVLKAEIVKRRIRVLTPAQALKNPTVLAMYEEAIEQRLQSVSRYEQIRKFTLMDRGFTIESGELTPKLSLRRKTIEENCGSIIDAMYRRE